MIDWEPHIRPRLAALQLSPARESEIVEELSQHLDERWQELVTNGASEDEATKLALAGFRDGDLLAKHLAPLRQARTHEPIAAGAPAGRLLADVRQDLRYAWRVSLRRPGFTVAAALTLAIGIGANSAVFSLVDAVLLQTLPVNRPEQLVLIDQVMARGGTQNISRPLFEHLRDEQQAFAGVLAAEDGITEVQVGQPVPGSPHSGDSTSIASGGLTDSSRSARVQAVSGEYFHVLGTVALIGRTLSQDDDRVPGAHPVAVVSHAFWTRRLGGDPQAIGHTISLAGHPFTIVGVARPEFFGEAVGRMPDIWVPMAMHPTLHAGPSLLGDPTTGWLKAMARLRPGVTPQQAEAALALLLGRLQADPATLGGMPRHIGTLQVADGSQGMTRLREQFSLPLRILTVAVAVVLLIACGNLATMLLARASTRRREIAIRLAIGADRRRLLRQFLTESALLAAIGGLLGLVLSWWGTRMLVLMAGTQGQHVDIDVGPDARLLAFNAFVSLGAVVLFGLAPALSASRADVSAEMKPTPGRRSQLHLAPMLVVTQVALSLPLIVGAVLLLQTLHNLRARDLGFAADALVQVRTYPQASGYTQEQIPDLVRRVTERLSGSPGVRAVAVAQSGFATGTSRTCCIAIPGRVFAADSEREVRTIGVGPGYFTTVGQRLRSGRDFTAHDVGAGSSSRTTVAVVNDAFVQRFLGKGHPIGLRFGWGNPPDARYDIEVVGVVNDAVYEDVRASAQPLFYFPSDTGSLYVVRAAGAPDALMSTLRREIQIAEPTLVVTAIAPVMADIDRALVRETLLARLSGAFGAVAAALAAIGLYGLMAYAVANRTRDIGIRMALGATRHRVLRAEIGLALRLVSIGVVIGIPLSIVGAHLIAAQLFGISAGDPLTLVAAAALMVLVGGVASYGPARRASQVDPMQALRSQ